MSAPRGVAIIATLGSSPYLVQALRSLRCSGGDGLRLRLVAPAGVLASPAVTEGAELADDLVSLDRNLGFAGNVNRGIGHGAEELVALVNDDAVVEPDWWPRLAAALGQDRGVAAVQGTVRSLADPSRIDGRGLAWNRWWQAVQIDHGETSDRPEKAEPMEIFGVSATAAVYRRSALDAVARVGARPFDESLWAYYEDVELAVRLRAAGWRSLWVPGAEARHAGSLTGDRLAGGKGRWLVGNRWRVVMDLLGRRFWRELPRIAGRDLRDVLARPATRFGGYGRGWARALVGMPWALRWGPPRLEPAEIERFRVAPDGTTRYHRLR